MSFWFHWTASIQILQNCEPPYENSNRSFRCLWEFVGWMDAPSHFFGVIGMIFPNARIPVAEAFSHPLSPETCHPDGLTGILELQINPPGTQSSRNHLAFLKTIFFVLKMEYPKNHGISKLFGDPRTLLYRSNPLLFLEGPS